MKRSLFVVLRTATCSVSVLLATPAWAATCPKDSVEVGNVCVDTYEASVWEIPTNNTVLINKVKKGTATLANLTAGGTQRGLSVADDYSGEDNGNDCDTIYAVSLPGVKSSTSIIWFQAQQACMNAGKRLLTNAEWQGAAAGTPDPGTDNNSTDCNITVQVIPTDDPANTGSRTNCVSRWGVFDMVGNVSEWVADWVPRSTACQPALFGTDDSNCLGGAADGTSVGPGAMVRGGNFANGTTAAS